MNELLVKFLLRTMISSDHSDTERDFPGHNEILKARRTIAPYAHKTAILTCQTLDALFGIRLFFKCENFQKAGAFKFRGAINALLSLDRKHLAYGVATHSSGNHAQALALAARTIGAKAYIVMPENASKVKVDAVRSYGGDITFCKPTLEARESNLEMVLDKTSAVEIHPYNDYRIIAGQSTVAAEIIESLDDMDAIIAPVGGGGLLSGTILSSRLFSPTTKIYGAEPAMANDAWQSFKSQSFVASNNPKTIADGLRTSLGSLTFPIIMKGAEDILTASEETIISAMKLIWERMKIVVEPSAAVPLAVIMEQPARFSGKKVALIVSGGNTDLDNLPWYQK